MNRPRNRVNSTNAPGATAEPWRPSTSGAGRRPALNWFALSLGAALTQAAQFAVVKGRAQAIPPLAIVAGTQLVAFTAWLLYFVFTRESFTPPGSVWPAIPASAVLVFGMASLLARASARGDISVVGPVFALSPIFTVVPDALLSGTLPSPLGWLGLLLAVAGTANLSRGKPGQGRIRALLGRSDALDALGAAVLLGGLAAVDRWGALAIGPASYLVCSHGAAALLTTAIVLVAQPRRLAASLSGRNLLTIGIHGVLGVTGTAMQTTALTTAPAAYVNAIRRLSAVAAVLLGSTLFREPDLGRRLIAALLACAGAACLLLA